MAVQFLHDEEEVHLVATISLYIKMSLGIANETRFFSYRQIERSLGRIALAEIESGYIGSRSLALQLASLTV